VRTAFRLLPSAFCLLVSSGCLVLSLQPSYDHESLAWDEALLGVWQNEEDNVTVTVERGEWRSYRVRYTHPVEDAEFTGHLTIVENTRFLDLMPLRGREHGPVLIPAHLVLRLQPDGARWRVSALDYDRLRALGPDRKHPSAAAGFAGPGAAFDERQHLVLTGDTRALRRWLRTRREDDFTEPATFERVP